MSRSPLLAVLTSAAIMTGALRGFAETSQLTSASAAAAQEIQLVDFPSSGGLSIQPGRDKNVSKAEISVTSDTLNGSNALALDADLVGRDAGWAGIPLAIRNATKLTNGIDFIALDACARGRTMGMFVTLNERDGSRWTANVRLGSEWREYRLPIYYFSWFSGPEERRASRPNFANLTRIDCWVGNTFQGANGFSVGNVRALDAFPTVQGLSLAAEGSGTFNSPRSGEAIVKQQRDTTLTVQLQQSAELENAPSDLPRQLYVEVSERDDVEAPRVVPIKNGRAEIAVYSRRTGNETLYAYEPHSGTSLTIPLRTISASQETSASAADATSTGGQVALDVKIAGVNGRQVVFFGAPLPIDMRARGGASGQEDITYQASGPKGMHVRLRDSTGAIRFSWNTFPQAIANRAVTLPALIAGPMQAEFIATREQLQSKVPQLPDGDLAVAELLEYPVLDELPSTATIVGNDRSTVWTLLQTSVDNTKPDSPFGLCGAALFHLNEEDIATTGRLRLDWHRRVGSHWGRNDLWWHEIERRPGDFYFPKAIAAADQYRANYVKMLGILDYGSAWAPNGAAPATEEERKQWHEFVKRVAQQLPQGVPVFEVWNEPNHGFWKPQPDPDAYRKLVRETNEALWEVRGKDRATIAGATAGYDPVFLEYLMKDGYADNFQGLSIHPYPEAVYDSPEANGLREECHDMRELMARNHCADKQAWITELGWPSAPSGVTEEQQASYLVRSYVMALAENFQKLFWFSLYDWERLPWVGETGAHTGLMDANYRPKLAYSAYNVAAFLLTRLKFLESRVDGRAVIYSFEVLRQSSKYAGGRVHVAWLLKPGPPQDVRIDSTAGGTVDAFNYVGAQVPFELVAGPAVPAEGYAAVLALRAMGSTTATQLLAKPPVRTYKLQVTETPVYLWDKGLPDPGAPAPKLEQLPHPRYPRPRSKQAQ